MSIAAVSDEPSRSVTLTTNLLVPAFDPCGIPTSPPSGAMLSQPGPLTLAKVSTSPWPSSGSVAVSAIEAEYPWSTLAHGSVNEAAVNEGGAFEFTTMFMVVEAKNPFVSLKLIANVLAPMPASVGVPETMPSGETPSHAGPE